MRQMVHRGALMTGSRDMSDDRGWEALEDTAQYRQSVSTKEQANDGSGERKSGWPVCGRVLFASLGGWGSKIGLSGGAL